MNATRDYYAVLGLTRDADDRAIKRAYRRLARRYHPDMNPAAPEWAAERFKEIVAAYEVLSDTRSRARYDRHGRPPLPRRRRAGARPEWKPYPEASETWRYIW